MVAESLEPDANVTLELSFPDRTDDCNNVERNDVKIITKIHFPTTIDRFFVILIVIVILQVFKEELYTIVV